MRAVVFRLSGDAAPVRAAVERLGLGAVEDEIATSDLGPTGSGWRRLGRPDTLALLGAPPRDEIGYWLAPVLAGYSRVRRVATLDAASGRARLGSLARYLAAETPFALAQLATGAAAIAAQRATLVGLAGGRPRVAFSAPARDSRRAVYLRAAVGTGVGVGGSITHTHEVIRALEREGTQVDPFTTDRWIASTAASDPQPPCRWRYVEIARLARAVPASVGFAGDLALVGAALRSARSGDFIYQRHARFSICGAVLARLSGRPLFLEFNGSEVWVQENWGSAQFADHLARCEDVALAAAARIIVVSEVERRTLEGRGVEPSRIIVSPNAVDPSRFDRGGGEAVRTRLGISPGELVYGFVGTFGPWHGVPELARAFAGLAAREPRARLLLVGDGDTMPEVRRVVLESGQAGRVHFAGAVSPAAVPAHLDACDVLVAPHVWNPDSGEFFGSPTKVFEYMASAKPIVASALGQIADVLEHDRTALLVPPGDVAALEAALFDVASDPQRRKRFGQNARADAVEKHSWRLNARQVLGAYEELTSNDRA